MTESTLQLTSSWATAYNLIFTSFPISYIALFDKDVTYERIMNQKEEEEYYKTNAFTGQTVDNSFTPIRILKTLPLIKKHIHKLYYTTQQGYKFTWTTFFGEVVNGIVVAFLLGYLGFNIFDGKIPIHEDGYTPDYWMVSFAIYGALIYSTNVVLFIRADQITWFYIGVIFLLTLIPYWILNFLFDTLINMENSSQRVLINLFNTYQYFMFAATIVVACVIIEFSKKLYRMYWKPSLVEYFQFLISNNLCDDPARFEDQILEAFQSNHDPIKRSQHRQMYMTKQLESELAQLSQDMDEVKDSKGERVLDARVDLLSRAQSAENIKRSVSNVTDAVKHDANTQENSHRIHMLDHPSLSDKHNSYEGRVPILSDANEDDDQLSISQHHPMSHYQNGNNLPAQSLVNRDISPVTEGHSVVQTHQDLHFNLDQSGSLGSSHGDLMRNMTPPAGNRNKNVNNLTIKVPSREIDKEDQNRHEISVSGQDYDYRLYTTQGMGEARSLPGKPIGVDKSQGANVKPNAPVQEEPDSPYEHITTPLPPKRGTFF